MEISVQMLTLLMFGSFALLLALGLPLAWTTLGIALLFSLILEGTSFFDIFVYKVYIASYHSLYISKIRNFCIY